MANLSGQPELDDDALETAEARMRRALGDLENQGSGRGHDAPRPRPDNRLADRHSGERPRARFVQDGDVPVTVLNRSRPHEAEGAGGGSNRLSVAEAALASERTMRLRAERAVAEAQAALHDLQTKLGHAELARQELAGRVELDKAAFEAERAALQAREVTLSEELAAERATRQRLELAPKAARRSVRGSPLSETNDTPEMRDASEATDRGEERVGAHRQAAETAPKRARQAGRPRASGAKKVEPKPVKWWLGPLKKK